jgi:predicted transcriptional regulator
VLLKIGDSRGMTARTRNVHRVDSQDQRDALSSPIRLEILGAFTAPGGLSIADVAQRMGRPASSLYYHFRILEQVGLLLRVGKRPRAKRPETLYQPVAPRIEVQAPQAEAGLAPVLKTMASAFRMAERDLEAALRSRTSRTAGRHRDLAAFRVHMRLTRDELAEFNEHLRALERFISRQAARKNMPPEADRFCSLTLAFLPLRGRGRE